MMSDFFESFLTPPPYQVRNSNHGSVKYQKPCGKILRISEPQSEHQPAEAKHLIRIIPVKL